MFESGTVLMVEDEPEITQAARIRLEAAGFGFIEALDGELGMIAAVTHRPDVILLDVRMPSKNGLSVLADLKSRSDTRDIPVVMLSASIVDQQAALDAGAFYFLRKPYRGDTLIHAVRAAIAAQGSASWQPSSSTSN